MKKNRNSNKVFPVSMAVLWSIVFANAMHSWVLGICIGVLMGLVFGMFDSEEGKDDERKNDEY